MLLVVVSVFLRQLGVRCLAQPTLIVKAKGVHWHFRNAITASEIAGSNLIQDRSLLFMAASRLKVDSHLATHHRRGAAMLLSLNVNMLTKFNGNICFVVLLSGSAYVVSLNL